MTKVSDIVTMAKATSLRNLVVGDDEGILIRFVQQGLNELHRKFSLNVNSEIVETSTTKQLYELKSTDLNKILAVYNSDGSTLNQSTLLESTESVYKLLSYKAFILNKPTDGYVIALYLGTSPRITSLDDDLPIPDAFEGALLMYIGYLGHTTINLDNTKESDVYLGRYLNACEQLVMEGYKTEVFMETPAIQTRGFI